MLIEAHQQGITYNIFVMLGRYGDILNILPLVYHKYKETNIKPILAISFEYKDIADSITYAHVIPLKVKFPEINQAIRIINEKYPNSKIYNCAVYGFNYSFKRECKNYQRESWKFGGASIPFGLDSIIIDNRNKEREQELIRLLEVNPSKSLILLNLRGYSSRLNEYIGEKIKIALGRLNEGTYQIIDISNVKAQNFLDLIGLFEIAEYLITIDTATLHLSRTVKNLKVIALINDTNGEWFKSEYYRNQVKRLFYSELNDVNIEKIVDEIENPKPKANFHLITTTKLNKSEDTKRREAFACSTWNTENKISGYRWKFHYYLNCDEVVKVKNMIKYAINKSEEKDIIVISNADVSFVNGISGWILDEIDKKQALYFHRHDFSYIDKPKYLESEISKGKWYCGSDMFAFTHQWWANNKEHFPDMYFGREAWDMVMRNLIKKTNGGEIHRAIYHERHKSFWESEEGKNSKENRHNIELAKKWLEQYGGNWNDWKFKLNNLIYK